MVFLESIINIRSFSIFYSNFILTNGISRCELYVTMVTRHLKIFNSLSIDRRHLFLSSYRNYSFYNAKSNGKPSPVDLFKYKNKDINNSENKNEIKPVKNKIPKRLSQPTMKDMWDLLSEIFVPTSSTVDILTRYHEKARKLYDLKIVKTQAEGNAHLRTEKDDSVLRPKLELYDLITNDPQQNPDMKNYSLYSSLKPTENSTANIQSNYQENSTSTLKNDFYFLPLLDDPKKLSATLFWACGTLSFLKSDFKKLLPPALSQISHEDIEDISSYLNGNSVLTKDDFNYNSKQDIIENNFLDFELIRNRNPETLQRRTGYFLKFKTREAALFYYKGTQNAELNGIKVSFKFISDHGYTLPAKNIGSHQKQGEQEQNLSDQNQTFTKNNNNFMNSSSDLPLTQDPRTHFSENIDPPILRETPNVTRSMCALISGLPPHYSHISITKNLWDYDLLENESKSVVKLSGDGRSHSESSFLLRFQNEDEPRRLVRDFSNRVWPGTDIIPFIEVLD